MAKYAQIVFMQGDEASEVGDMMNDNGVAAVVEYLAQWDMGEYHEVRAESAASGADMFSRSHREGDYVLTWNPYVCHFGLEREVEDDYSPFA